MIRRGVHRPLEDAANAMLAESLRGVKSHTAKSDILTPWKEKDRRHREVYVNSGVPDPAVRKGMFKREPNVAAPRLNSREGIFRADRTMQSLSDFVISEAEE